MNLDSTIVCKIVPRFLLGFFGKESWRDLDPSELVMGLKVNTMGNSSACLVNISPFFRESYLFLDLIVNKIKVASLIKKMIVRV